MKFTSFFAFLFFLNFSSAQINFGKFGDLFKSKNSNFELKKRVFVFASSGNKNINAGVELRFNKQSSKWQFFSGLRILGIKSSNNDFYITAPPKYRTNVSTWNAGFLNPVENNLDTVNNLSGNTFATNLYFKVSRKLIQILGAQISTDLSVDLAGFNFNGKNTAVLTSNGVIKNTNTSSNSSNLRLLGASDVGNLNAELTFRLGFDKLSIYWGWAILKREVVTKIPQNLPNGSNSNFRSTTNGQVFGLRYRI